jgi:hypothetical protein
MKNIVLPLLALIAFLPCFASAQTKEESEAWIIEQTKFNLDGRLVYAIAGKSLVSKLELPFPPVGPDVVNKSISLASVKRMSFLHTDKFLSFSLMCDYQCAHQINTDHSGKFQSERRSKKFLFEIYKPFDKSFPPRMQKALMHLITLHGGKAEMVSHDTKKEAF